MSTLLAILRVLGTDCSEEFNEVRQPEHAILDAACQAQLLAVATDAASLTLFGTAFLMLAWLLTSGAAQPLDQKECSTSLALKSLSCIVLQVVVSEQQDGSSSAPRLLCPLSCVWQPSRKH